MEYLIYTKYKKDLTSHFGECSVVQEEKAMVKPLTGFFSEWEKESQLFLADRKKNLIFEVQYVISPSSDRNGEALLRGTFFRTNSN